MHLAVVVPLVVLSLLGSTNALRIGAGRAFPIRAENYIVEKFQNINPQIEWDPTNFLIDLSGQFAHCESFQRGYEQTKDLTPKGYSIGVVYDYYEGSGTDSETVASYIIYIVDSWMRTDQYHYTIETADTFGCSVRPGCPDGRNPMKATVVCLFSPARYRETDIPGVPYRRPNPIRTPRPTPAVFYRTRPPFDLPLADHVQRGKAFTSDQYAMAARITHNKWDQSHFLENLSGFETSCSMMNKEDWEFKEAIDIARSYGMTIMGLKGEARNYGDTQEAMERVLENFKEIQSASQVGCSVIPDCFWHRGDLGDEMWVVVACVYEEPQYRYQPYQPLRSLG